MTTRPEPWETGHVEKGTRVLPHGAVVERLERGWGIRVPLRQDRVEVRRRTVAVREVTVRPRLVEETRVFDEVVAREEATVEREPAGPR